MRAQRDRKTTETGEGLRAEKLDGRGWRLPVEHSMAVSAHDRKLLAAVLA